MCTLTSSSSSLNGLQIRIAIPMNSVLRKEQKEKKKFSCLTKHVIQTGYTEISFRLASMFIWLTGYCDCSMV